MSKAGLRCSEWLSSGANGATLAAAAITAFPGPFSHGPYALVFLGLGVVVGVTMCFTGGVAALRELLATPCEITCRM